MGGDDNNRGAALDRRYRSAAGKCRVRESVPRMGVADQLNALYNDPVGPNEKCSTDDGQSYKCSGVIIRGGDAGRDGRSYGLIGSGIAAFPWSGVVDPPNYTIGIESLTSAVCPPDIVDGEYPAFCPDPTAINVGSISFGFLRRDVAPPLSEVQSWVETGIDPYTGQESPWGGPVIAWPGGGMILMQENSGYTNPDAVLPVGDDGVPSSSFWDHDRVGNFWPMDGSTFGRASCGNGPGLADMQLGVSGPIQNNSMMAYWLSNNCHPSAAGWEATSIPEGYERSCSASTVESVETYYDTWLSAVERLFNDINCTSEEYDELTDELCNLMFETGKNAPQGFACGIAPEDFDDAMVPLTKSIPYKVLFESLEEYNIEATSFSLFFGIWNEVAIKAWNGVTFVELGAHLVLWYDDGEGSKERAYQRAEEFYTASGINGGANIRIPVVYRDNNQLYIDPAVDFNTVFSCPADDTEGTTATETEGSTSSSPSVFSQLPSLSASISTILLFTFVLFEFAI